MLLDTNYTIHTPEGIALTLSPAGPLPRFYAWSIDLLVRSVINLIFSISLVLMFDNFGLGLAFIFMFLLEWFYPVWFELKHHGQTPGKRLMNLYVTQADASPVSPAASLIRNLLRFVDFLPFFYGFGLLSMLVNKRFQRLGDLAANTVVLHKSEHLKLSVSPTEPLEEPRLPGVKLSLTEQQALIMFAQREKTLSAERQQELAQLTGTLVQDQADAAAHLRGIALWLTGGGKT